MTNKTLGGSNTSEEPSGVKCFGCGKHKKIVTKNNKRQQALCSRCNNMLRRRFGKKYGEVLDNPAATLQALEEADQDTKDRKKIRRDFFAVLNVLEEIEKDRHAEIWHGCRDYFAELDEAQPFLTFEKDFYHQMSNSSEEPEPRAEEHQDDSAKKEGEEQQGDSAQEEGEE